jgi:hypothetical protein
MAKITDQKLKLLLNNNKLIDFISHIEDLNRIGDTIKIKIDTENIHIYSMLGESVMLAFKNFILPTKEYFPDFKEEFLLNIIIIDTPRFVKNLKLLKTDSKIEWEIVYRHTNSPKEGETRVLIIKNGKLKIQPPCGEDTEIKDITKEKIKKFQDIKNRKWCFNINSNDFSDIKQLANINKDENKKIINIEANGGKVILSETSNWELEIDEIEDPNKYHIMFNKSFLSSIKIKDEITFHIFENFILLKDVNESLMISFEQTFD